MSSLSKRKACEIASVIVQAARSIRVEIADHQHIYVLRGVYFTCYWCSSQGWVPWQIELDAVALVAKTLTYDGKVYGKDDVPSDRTTWTTGWLSVFNEASEILRIPKRQTKSVALQAVPTKRLLRWRDAARRLARGEITPQGWGRSFTIANLTAELSTRSDRHTVSDAKKQKQHLKVRKVHA